MQAIRQPIGFEPRSCKRCYSFGHHDESKARYPVLRLVSAGTEIKSQEQTGFELDVTLHIFRLRRKNRPTT